MSSVHSSIPDGYHPPFATITPTDHRAWIIIATALCMACFLFFCMVRLGLRFVLRQRYEYDDFTCWAATVLAAIQSSIILGASARGMGKSTDLLSPSELDSVQKLYYAANFFFILSIGMSKISVLCLIHRISRVNSNKRAIYVIMGVVGAWTIASIFSLALKCDFSHPWIIVDEKCPRIRTRWNAICALDIATELGIFGLVIQLVYPLQMVFLRKLSVVYIFSFRLLVVVFIAFRLHTLSNALHFYTTNPFLHLAQYICWTQAEVSYSLITATVPAFRNFLKSLHTGFGGISALERSYGYGSQLSTSGQKNRQHSGTNFQLSRLTRRRSVTDRKDGDQLTSTMFSNNTKATSVGVDSQFGSGSGKPWSQDSNASDQITATDSERDGANASANAHETTSIASNESRRMMIRKDVNWSIRTEPRITSSK